jgi:hypothetical protein
MCDHTHHVCEYVREREIIGTAPETKYEAPRAGMFVACLTQFASFQDQQLDLIKKARAEGK